MANSAVIYFVRRDDGLVKVGTSSNFDVRLDQLQASHGLLEVLRVINGDARREKNIHGTLRRHNEYGEWFRDSDDLRQEIAALEDGSYVEVAQTEQQRAWREGEAETVQEAQRAAARILELRRSRSGKNDAECISALSEDYGFTVWFFTLIAKGRASSVSAWGYRVLRRTLVSELEATRDTFIDDIQAESDRIEGEAASMRDLLARITAKRTGAA